MQESDNHLPSKSQRKRDMLALQKMGEALVALPLAQFETIPLPSLLSRAITEARALTSHEAKRRQLQYIGKLMRHVDIEPIQDALNKIQLKDKQSNAQFHKLEYWRDELIAKGDEALQLFCEQFPDCDRQELRQLVRNAQQDLSSGKNRGNDTQLFRYLRKLL